MNNLNWIQVFLLMLFDKICHHLGMQKYLINIVRYMIQLHKR
jgi:hypothetical protein